MALFWSLVWVASRHMLGVAFAMLRLFFGPLVWRVGDGNSINIWNDRWLPTPGSHKVQSPMITQLTDAKVSVLLDVETNWWKTDLVHSLFGPEEAETICGMPVCPRTRQDQLVWAGTKHGNFTVRSAYHMGMEEGVREEGSSSNGHHIAVIWKEIWRIKCARVVKIFLWQACTNILPTKERLFKRHISDDPLCPLCGLATETTAHILWNCPSTKDVWLECNARIQKCTSDEVDFLYIMEKLMERLDVDQMVLVATVARQIWFRRNSVVFGGDMVSPALVLQRAKDQVEMWRSVSQRPANPTANPAQTVAVTWSKPPDGYVKINWDASVNKQQKKMGAGVVVRDSAGGVLAMYCMTKDSITSPSVAEALGAWAAVELAVRMELRRVVFEGDALEIINALRSEECCWAVYGQTLNAIKMEMVQQRGWSFQHVSRLANGEAHKLARLAFVYGYRFGYLTIYVFMQLI
jgi:hypothetical protein